MGNYSKKLVEFCCSRVLSRMCCNVEELINNGVFSQFTFDMMHAWEMPNSEDEVSYTVGPQSHLQNIYALCAFRSSD